MENEIIPPEIKGKNTNLDKSIVLDTKDEAVNAFKRAYKRMLNPGIWHKLSGAISAQFTLTGEDATEEERLAQEGDYFKIDLPGPGPATGDGYDWVRVELLKDHTDHEIDEESIGMKLRACSPPGKDTDDTAHFFKDDATSSFIIRRTGTKVTASYFGRNEIPNTDTNKATDNIRNTMVAMGAIAGLSELQWSALLEGFLEEEIGE
ncbi:MAG: hypothetical protein ABIN01_15060 [Ferruginibacter sp.]